MGFLKRSTITAVGLCAATLMAAAQQAEAQAIPAPFGNWQSATSATRLVVTQSGCAMYAYERVQVAGACSWNAGSVGGILTITYPMPLEPGRVQYTIVWVNKNAITVFGEPFRRR